LILSSVENVSVRDLFLRNAYLWGQTVVATNQEVHHVGNLFKPFHSKGFWAAEAYPREPLIARCHEPLLSKVAIPTHKDPFFLYGETRHNRVFCGFSNNVLRAYDVLRLSFEKLGQRLGHVLIAQKSPS
jgi:hypothetical protein